MTIAQASNVVGVPSKTPYDRILVSAEATTVPRELLEQLKLGGTMVIPVNGALIKIHKDETGNISTEKRDGFVFVPLR